MFSLKKKKKILSKTEQSGTVLIMNNEHMKLYTIFSVSEIIYTLIFVRD